MLELLMILTIPGVLLSYFVIGAVFAMFDAWIGRNGWDNRMLLAWPIMMFKFF